MANMRGLSMRATYPCLAGWAHMGGFLSNRPSCIVQKKVTLMTFNEYKIKFSYGYEFVSTEKRVLVLLTYVGGSYRA